MKTVKFGLCTTNVLSTLLLFFYIYLQFENKNTNIHGIITTIIENIGNNIKHISKYQIIYHVVRKNFFLVNCVFENKYEITTDIDIIRTTTIWYITTLIRLKQNYESNLRCTRSKK